MVCVPVKAVVLYVQLAREVLDAGVSVAVAGATTDEIDRVVHEAAVERECYPSPLNYHGFPKSCCTSINEVICHGIPDMRPLQKGDICNSKYGEEFLVGHIPARKDI